jgi:hypothetical protein
MRTLDEKTLIERIEAGIARTQGLIAVLTDYEGGPVSTEYLLTADIAREFVEAGYETGVEVMNRSVCNALVSPAPALARQQCGTTRTDVVVWNSLMPLALVELKIRIRTLGGLISDLEKIVATLNWLHPHVRQDVFGASVFQVHLKGRRGRETRQEFEHDLQAVERALRSDLRCHEKTIAGFDFELIALRPNPGDGIVPRRLEPEEGGNMAWGPHGYAIQYYLVLIRASGPRVSSAPTGFADLKARGVKEPV